MSTPINPVPFSKNYADMRKDGIDQQELVKLSQQAVADHQLDDQEKAAFGEIFNSQLETHGELSTDQLMALPVQVQNLFQEMSTAQRPEVPKPVSAFELLGDGPLSLDDLQIDPALLESAPPQGVNVPGPVSIDKLLGIGMDRLKARQLTPARQEMKKQLDAVLTTSRWGYEPTKAEEAAGKRNLFDKMKAMSSGTTCGLLPGSMLRHMGVNEARISGNATNGIETEGKRLGVWVESTGSGLPKPGDIYALRYEDAPDTQDSVAHVGVVYATADGQWTTADAGQGTKEKQAAGLVQRNLMFDAQSRPYLSGPDNIPGDSAAFRRIAGWVDIDQLMFLQTYQDLLLGTVDHRKRTQGQGIDEADLQKLAGIAMRDGSLSPSEQRVFTEIAHQQPGFSEATVQSLPQPIQEIFQAAAGQPAPPPIPLPGDVFANDAAKQGRRRFSAIEGARTAVDHS